MHGDDDKATNGWELEERHEPKTECSRRSGAGALDARPAPTTPLEPGGALIVLSSNHEITGWGPCPAQAPTESSSKFANCSLLLRGPWQTRDWPRCAPEYC